MKKYRVNLYYSGYCTRVVEANDEDDALEIASAIDLDEKSQREIINSLERWEDADEVEEVW